MTTLMQYSTTHQAENHSSSINEEITSLSSQTLHCRNTTPQINSHFPNLQVVTLALEFKANMKLKDVSCMK